MSNQKKLVVGLSGSAIVLVVVVIVALVMGQNHTTGKTTSQAKQPKINQARIMKRIDYETFNNTADTDGATDYVANENNIEKNTYIDGEVFGNRESSVADMVYSSAGLPNIEDSILSFGYFFKAHEINNLTTKWDKDGQAIIAKGNFVIKDTGKKYPFAFKFDASYMITQEWYGKDIKI